MLTPVPLREGACSASADVDAIADYLLGRGGEPPSPELLRRWRLAAYAYTALPADHPRRSEVRADYLAALGRHAALRQEALPLLRAWRAAGIEAILFKGFALAEWVYPVPGARFHGDVDVLLRDEQISRATNIARETGWLEATNAERAGQPYSHGACTLARVGGATEIDVHRFAIHSRTPFTRVPRRITDAVWAHSREHEWEGVPVRTPSPVDAVLILMLHRCWGGDGWCLKPHDVLDMRVLRERAGVTRADLVARARELGCARTLSLFLARCDPMAERLDLTPPTPAERRRLARAVRAESGVAVMMAKPLGRLLRLPRVLADTLRALPVVWRVRRALDTQCDMHRLLARLTAPTLGGRVTLVAATPLATVCAVRGVRWAMHVIPRGAHGACVVRSLSLLVLLRRAGWPASFVSGVRRENGELTGHAWVELHGRVLPELEEPLNRERYRVNFSYPPEPASVTY